MLFAFLVGAVAGVLGEIVSFLPIIGGIINAALGIIVFLLWLFSWIYALSGEKKDVAVVGEWAKKIKI